MGRRRRVRVPGSSANLGPGFDAMAAAVSVHLELEVEETGEFSVDPGDPRLPADETNLCVRAFADLHPVDGLTLPDPLRDPARGRARVERRRDRRRRWWRPTTCTSWRCRARRSSSAPPRIEGHPDNVAASLYGGFVICADGDVTRHRAAVRTRGGRGDPGRAGADRRGARGAARRGAARGRDLQRRARRAAHARARARRPGADRARPRGPPPPAAPRAHLYPRSMDLVAARARPRRARRDDLGRRARPCCSGSSSSRPARSSTGCARRSDGWAEVRRLNFVALGADVAEL